MEFSLEEVAAVSASSFLQINAQVPFKEGLGKDPFKDPFLLPSLSVLLDEEDFAIVALSYGERGIYISIEINQPFQEVSFPKVQQGDGIEIFIDTRDVKTSGSLHKFCHHFIFLPKPVSDVSACEVTRLRAEDSHPLADSSLLHVESQFYKESYQLNIHIESEALFGFDPKQMPRIGFAYKIHRARGPCQNFSHSDAEFQIEKYPHLWPSLLLK